MQRTMAQQAHQAHQEPREAGRFTRRIGPTTYRVGVHFSGSSKETANEKLVRLIRWEIWNATSRKAVNE